MISSGDFLETRPSLLAALQGGVSKEAPWREFFELYAPPIYRVALLRGLGSTDAEDIVQQVMLGVIEYIGDFRYERDRTRFRTWVLRIAEYKIADVRRKRRPVSGSEMMDGCVDEQASVPPLEQWEQQWKYQDMLYCLEQVAADLAPRRMLAFRMYALQGVSAEDTARELGITVANVYTTRTQVLAMIRQRMQWLEAAGGRVDSAQGDQADAPELEGGAGPAAKRGDR